MQFAGSARDSIPTPSFSAVRGDVIDTRGVFSAPILSALGNLSTVTYFVYRFRPGAFVPTFTALLANCSS